MRVPLRIAGLITAIGMTSAMLHGDEAVKEIPSNTAVIPIGPIEKDHYDWMERHEAVLHLKDSLDPQIVLIGDSIFHRWGGEPPSPEVPPHGPESYHQLFNGKRVLNLGYGWDRTQNVLWRLEHGEIDGLRPELFIVNIGSNNFEETANAHANTPEEIAAGIHAIVASLQAHAPGAGIVLMGVFPVGTYPDHPLRRPIQALNNLLARDYANVPGVHFLDITDRLLLRNGIMPQTLMPDGVHPSEQGYAVWAEALAPLVTR